MDRFQEEFENSVTFIYLNARDDAEGETAFQQLSLRGHPTIVLFDASGSETHRTFGLVDESILQSELATIAAISGE